MGLIFCLLHLQNSARAILLRIDECQRSMVDLSGAGLLSWRVGKCTLGDERERSVSQMPPVDDARNGTGSDALPISLRED